ncbi:MAG: glycosyltransferase [Ruminiclostridium sp.]|nr:glycosyltransferase [Ruminiclostridium sp.]
MNEKLNICLLNDSFPPLIDGVATCVINYATVIERELGKATVVTPAYPGAEDKYSFPVVRYSSLATERSIGYRAGYPFSASKLEALKNSMFDVIHSHCPFASTVFARNLKEKNGAQLIMTYHTKFNEDIKRVIDNPLLEKQITKFVVQNISVCDEVWTVSRGAGENLRSIGYEGNYIIMPNGVDFPKGKASKEDTDALRYEYGIPQDMPLFLFVGRLFWYKNFKVMLEALKYVKESGTDFRMMIVGDGGDAEAIRQEAERLGVIDKILFAGAINDRAELRIYYTAADLFFFPSVYDTNGIVVREAAACGLPSLLIEGSCAAEDFTNYENAILTENDPFAISKELIHAATHIDALKTMGENAMNDVYLSWEDAVKNAFNRYNVVLQNYKRGITQCRETKTQEILYSSVSSITDSIQKVRSITASAKRKTIKTSKTITRAITGNISKKDK